MSELRAHYLKVNQQPPASPVEEWLCDNYYVIEKECKQTLRDIRALSRRCSYGELERFYALFESVLFTHMPPLDDEHMTELLRGAEKARHISENQFCFVPAAIKAALLRMVYNAVFESRSEDMIRYAIMGFSRLTSIDFDEIVYQCSCVERILSRDPSGVYPAMDSDSRRHYRHLIAKIAADTRRPEDEVAEEMLSACLGREGAQAHIGSPILGHPCVNAPRLRRGRVTLIAGAALPVILSLLISLITGSIPVGLLCFFPLWEILRTPLWQGAIAGVDADFIPRMDPKKVKEKPKTVVLVSTLLPGAAQVPELADRLRQLYYSNSDPDMYYCVLADFKEWDFPTDEKDDSQVTAARKMIETLNRRHDNRFMLFLRSRTFNRTQNRYSGWERKRGAITEFIRHLKGEPVGLHTFVGDENALPQIKYIIALDADTNLLYESAQTLVLAAIHPLNAPVIGEDGVVVSGYGILTPKISPDLGSARATAFSRVMSGCGGVTAYDTRDKDFYQDLFFESIFAGKGLIDADAFYELLSDRFPENRILSHDILEGAYLRTGFVSDVEMTDTAPSSMGSWLSRLHRWLRGDWQNLPFLGRKYRAGGRVYRNPISGLSRYKLFDNLRRSITPAACFLCVTAALFAKDPAVQGLLATLGTLGVIFPSLWAAFFSLLSGGFFTLSRKFFTRTLPHAFELLSQGIFLLIMLPAQTVLTLDAVCRSLWRTFISHKKMLEWTTAAQTDSRRVTLLGLCRRFWLAELLGTGWLILGAHSALSLLGAAFALFIPVARISAVRSSDPGGTPSRLGAFQRDTLISYCAAMWRYYEDFATAEHHYLPPDNIQQSPVYRVAGRTSPTNIGMMLLSILSARDLDFIDTDGLYERIDRTLSTVEALAMWHGNLYNWYDTLTLETLKPEFVSTVDSGNYVCCLVALIEGLKEFLPEKPSIKSLITRLQAIIDSTDLTVFYNKKKNLFSIGYDVPSETLSDSHYDFLMSEARLTSYYAVAAKLVGKKHWGTLIRTMSRSGFYAGAVSWTGTMFEYFMPHLLLPVYEGSLLGEALIYCLYCQKRRVREPDLPWGISESAFYAFDNNLNYQYKAHGVRKIGVKRYLDRDLVISPYSTFLTIPWSPNSSMDNLRRLRDLGVYGRYGFFEAVDFTASRVGEGNLSVTRSYMAHHIGMSLISSINALFDGRMQTRFMSNDYMRSAGEFLQEKIAKSTVVYDDLKNTESRGEKHERPGISEERHAIHPQSPRAVMLTNGEITDVLTDTGAGFLTLGESDLTRRSADLLRRPQGVFAVVRMEGVTLSATAAPFYDPGAYHMVEYQEHTVLYHGEKGTAGLSMGCMMHPTISCEQRRITVKNQGPKRARAELLIYCEPVLSPNQDYGAHPAFSKLFVSAACDRAAGTLTFKRRDRDATRTMYLTAGFLEDVRFDFETHRELLCPSPEGLMALKSFYKKPFAGGDGVPDACCALRLSLSVPAGGEAGVTLLLCASRTEAEGVSGIISMRKIGLLDQKTAARSLLLGDTLEGKLGAGILGQLLFSQRGAGDLAARAANSLGQRGLWPAGISGDLPIALFEPGPAENSLHPDEEIKDQLVALESYLRLHGYLRSSKVEFDLVILYEREIDREDILRLIGENCVPGILGSRGGVFVLHRETAGRELLTLLSAVARHIWRHGSAAHTGDPGAGFDRAEILSLSPEPVPDAPELAVKGGCFLGGRFYSDRASPLPWCHVLSNHGFGTLLSDQALGYTWAYNSRENKLTPWFNDVSTDNNGEMLLLQEGTRLYNLVQGSRASFSPLDALYEGRSGKFSASVRVSVPRRGNVKYLDVTLRNLTDLPYRLRLAYYTEPVLGVSRDASPVIVPRLRDGALILHNPWNTAVRSYSAIGAPGREDIRFTTDRCAFLCGSWQEEAVSPWSDACAAAILPLELPAKGEETVRFALSWGSTPAAALWSLLNEPEPLLDEEPWLRIKTPDQALNQFINHFAPHQIKASRLFGRTAFYQCGGAYGFRDQLQDAMACQILEPELLKAQILRCCAAQFEEGDVLHWWHPLPALGGGIKGVRTRFSDDLLWLPLAVAEYVEKTGDAGILSLPVPYRVAEELKENEQEKYITPERGATEDVFSHCVRALERGSNLGERGLPLIGCGDWCDGFSSVGVKGRGRSVWLAMFLIMVLERFVPLCKGQKREDLMEIYRERAKELRKSVDAFAWDGDWYLRAFYDDGSKMGGHEREECFIDLLPQSFAVMADMPDGERVASALTQAYKHLYDEKLGLVRLFKEPFHDSDQQPGYVKAYPEGIRENGGQYTHAAVWFAIALLRFGFREEGFELLKALNPVSRNLSPELAASYKLEPYYIAADIYSNPSVPGRGGWSIYTGAAAWYLRAIVEELLGMRLSGGHMTFEPQIPPEWDGFSMELFIRGTRLSISVNRGASPGIILDGKSAGAIPLDGGTHSVQLVFEKSSRSRERPA
jgi:cyclic beta-1,2-glucan synthetase